jgi:hypothetical protein
MQDHLTKAQRHSLARLYQAIADIERLVSLEQKRLSFQRKKVLEHTHATLRLHAGKLQITFPALGSWYDPEDYLKNARYVAAQLARRFPALPTLSGGEA